MPVYAHTLRNISILNYRLEFRLISRFCNDTPFREVDDVSRMNHNGENHPIIGCYRCYRSVRLIKIPIYNSKLIFYKKQTYFIENTILYIYSISIISSSSICLSNTKM
jgi:hypothetical protein